MIIPPTPSGLQEPEAARQSDEIITKGTEAIIERAVKGDVGGGLVIEYLAVGVSGGSRSAGRR